MSKGKLKSRQANKSHRIVSAPDTGTTNNRIPIFSLEFLQRSFCLSKCNDAEKAAFADALFKRSKMTWNQITLAPKEGLGSETIAYKAIRAAIPKHITEDVTFLAMRFNGSAPMVGFRDNQVFYVLWLDRNYTLYNHG